jgi:uncharacterized protein YuzE
MLPWACGCVILRSLSGDGLARESAADAAYIYLTGERLTRGRTSIPATPLEGVQAFIVLDWKGDRLVGIEILDASTRLNPDLLEEAEILS